MLAIDYYSSNPKHRHATAALTKIQTHQAEDASCLSSDSPGKIVTELSCVYFYF